MNERMWIKSSNVAYLMGRQKDTKCTIIIGFRNNNNKNRKKSLNQPSGNGLKLQTKKRTAKRNIKESESHITCSVEPEIGFDIQLHI